MENKINPKRRFQKFLTEKYKEEISELFRKYPDEDTLIVDYDVFEMFDPDYADLLIERPDISLELVHKAIKDIDPLLESANIFVKFDNVSNVIPFSKLTSNHVGKLVVVECTIQDIKKPAPKLDTAIFECRGCMRLHEVDQVGNGIIEPTLCSECGGRSFNLLQAESKYIDHQVIQVTDENTSRTLSALLKGHDCSYDDYCVHEKLQITGVLRTFSNGNGFDYYFDVHYVVKLPDSSTEEIIVDDGDRNYPEYKEWVKQVINRDKVCQCCGAEKHLEAHHIFGYKNNPDYRVNPDNGIALCKWCHGKYHSYHGIATANPQSLIKFVRRFGKY